MELHQVRYFLAVCETLNFTRAALSCHVSQPSLTRAIKVLELELGGPLFNRERGNTHLTELGLMVQPHLREVIAQTLAVRSRAAALLTLRAARLSLGVGFGFALGHIAATLGGYAAGHPDVEIALHESDADDVHAALRRGEIELAFLPGRPHDIDDLHYHRVGADGARLLVRAGHGLAGRAESSLAELAGESLAVWAGCRFLPPLEKAMAERGLTLRTRLTARTPAQIPVLVESCGVVGLCESGFATAAGLTGCAILELPDELPVFAATKRGRPYSPALRAFLGLLLRRPPLPRQAGLA